MAQPACPGPAIGAYPVEPGTPGHHGPGYPGGQGPATKERGAWQRGLQGSALGPAPCRGARLAGRAPGRARDVDTGRGSRGLTAHGAGLQRTDPSDSP